MGFPDSPSVIFPQLRRQLLRLILLRAAGRVVAGVVLSVIVAGGLDWWLRFETPAARYAATLGVVSVGVGLLLHSVVIPLCRRLSDNEFAALIEQAEPGLRGALTSSVEFSARGCHPSAGAPALQRDLILRTTTQAAEIATPHMFDTRGIVRAAAAAALSCLVGAAVIMFAPQRTAIALQRLAAPDQVIDWPRQYALVLLDSEFNELTPSRDGQTVSATEPLQLYVVDRNGTLPDDMALHTSLDQSVTSRPLEVIEMLDRNGQPIRVCSATIPPGPGTIHIRASGGDDDRMPWHEFRRLTPPSLEQLQITIVPPPYANQSDAEYPAPGRLTALVGSRVRITARSSSPLTAAVLRNDQGASAALDTSESSRFETEFAVDVPETRAYWFDLTDERGLNTQTFARFELQGVEDTEPFVAVRRPAADLSVTPVAVVPLEIVARDDVGLAQLRLTISEPSGSVGRETITLPETDASPRSVELTSQITVADFDLAPGRQLAFHVEADDAYDLGPRHTAESQHRMLTIVSPEEKLNELIAKQTQIGAQLKDLADRQKRALRQTGDLTVQWQTAGVLKPEDTAILRRVNVDQKRIANSLQEGQSSVIQQTAAVLDELEWNQLDDRGITQRLRRFVDDLQGLSGEFIELQQSLGRALRMVETERSRDVETSLARVETSQSRILTVLQQSLAQFETWQQRHEVIRSFDALAAEQREVAEETVVVGRKTLARRYAQLSVQEQADLARLAARQRQLAPDLVQFANQCDALEAQSESAGSIDAQTLQDIRDVIRSEHLDESMSTAGRFVDQNRIADAVSAQETILKHFDRIERLLRNSAEESPETLIRQIDEAQADVEALRTRQEQLVDRTASAMSGMSNDDPVELRKQQVELARAAQESAQRLLKRQVGRAGTSASRAADAMHAAAEGIEDEIAPSVPADQREALDDLLQAERELHRLRRQLDMNRVSAHLAELAQAAESFHARQQRLLEETVGLEETLKQQGRLGRSELRSLRQLAEDERHLGEDVTRSRGGATEGDVFEAAFRMAAEQMERAANLLDEREVGAETQTAQQEALAILDQIATASSTQAAPREDTTAAESTESSDSETMFDASLIPQCELLLNMQRRLADRIAGLTQAQRERGVLTTSEQQELSLLAEQQSQLHNHARRILGGQDDRENNNSGDPADAPE